MKSVLALLLALVLALSGGGVSAMAEDTCVVDMDANPGVVSTDCGYLRLVCTLPEEAPVVITLWDGYGNLFYQRNYGLCVGDFRTEDIYLRLSGGETRYVAQLDCGSWSIQATVIRRLPRLRGNAACTVGYPLSALTGRDTWQSVTLLDAQALEGSSKTVSIHAAGAYDLGQATFSVSGGYLYVDAWLYDGVDDSIDSGSIQVATTSVAAQRLGSRGFSGPTGNLGQAIDLQGAEIVAVYVSLTVSFDPSGVMSSPQVQTGGQAELWQRMVEQTESEAVG